MVGGGSVGAGVVVGTLGAVRDPAPVVVVAWGRWWWGPEWSGRGPGVWGTGMGGGGAALASAASIIALTTGPAASAPVTTAPARDDHGDRHPRVGGRGEGDHPVDRCC